MSQILRDLTGAVGASIVATATDGAIFYALVIVAKAPVWFSALCAAASGGIVHYGLSRFAVFKRFDAPVSQSAAKYVIMSSAAALLYAAGTEFTVPLIGLTAAWVLLKVIIFAGVTYPLSRYWVFGPARRLQPCEDSL